MDFVDDDLEELHCFHPTEPRNSVQDDYVCDDYKLNQAVKADADMGMW
jgi:hypothetical protein